MWRSEDMSADQDSKIRVEQPTIQAQEQQSFPQKQNAAAPYSCQEFKVARKMIRQH